MRLQSATDSPDLTNSHDLQQAITPMRLPYIYHPTSLSLPAFCCGIGEFGERLSGGDTYTDRDTCLLQYFGADIVSKLEQRFRQAGQVSKRLINLKERSVAMDIALCLITPLSNTRLDVHWKMPYSCDTTKLCPYPKGPPTNDSEWNG